MVGYVRRKALEYKVCPQLKTKINEQINKQIKKIKKIIYKQITAMKGGEEKVKKRSVAAVGN